QQMTALLGPGGAVNEAMRRVGPLAAATANAGLNALLVLVAGIFFALSQRRYRDGVLLLAPRPMRGQLREALDLAGSSLRRWLGGTIVSMLAICVMVGVGFWALGALAPLGLALIAGLAQFVPLIGPTISSAPALLLGFTVSPTTPLWVALLYVGATTLEAHVLTPLIQRRAVSLSPVVILFSVVAFGLLFGPLGVFLAVPMAVVATIFVVKFYVNDALGEHVGAPGEKNGANGDGSSQFRPAASR
ncbi:MAG: AI-2E family transporter, partial [Parvularculaceae bacterium]|nr:AI-2E family transporter [Parvularculaceae bacterium]